MIDLQALLDDVIETYGENKGYRKPTIQWSEENMLWRYGEYQYWLNRILVSRLLNTDKVSKKALQSIIYHEYTHQVFIDHSPEFQKCMARFPGFESCEDELDRYLQSLDALPPAKKRPSFDFTKQPVVFCLLPSAKNDNYHSAFMYMNHFLCIDFGKKRAFSRAITDACPNSVVWLYRKDDKLYMVGWSMNVRFFPSAIVVKNQPYGGFNYKYQALVRQRDCRILSPGDAADIPVELLSAQFECSGACLDSEMADYSPENVYQCIGEYDGEYDDLYTSDDTIESLSPLTIDSVPTLINMSQKYCNCNRGMWIANLAVQREPSYETYMNRASILFVLCIYDLAERDYQSALEYKPGDPTAKKELSRIRAILSQPGCPTLP